MKARATIVRALRDNVLLLLTLVGVILGIGLGFAVRATKPSASALLWLGLPGQLYLRLLKMMIVPLIISSVITGTASLDPKSNGRISMVAATFIFLTNMVGALMGVATFFVFRPGKGGSSQTISSSSVKTQPMDTQDVFADLLRNFIPDNLFEATFSQTQTQYKYATNSTPTNHTTFVIIEKSVGKADGPNLLGLIVACTLVGIAASSLKALGKPLIDFFEAATQTVIVMIRWFLWVTPVGVLSLILVPVASLADVAAIFQDLGLFIISVVSALIVQQVIVMPVILFLTTRTNPLKFMICISRPWLIALAAASTAVAIPEMLNACETKLGVDRRIARFVIPFSVTLSANGSAVFIACSCLFINNFNGIHLTIGTAFMVGFLATVSSLAIPSVPSSSIVTIVMILTALNIPVEAIALLLTVDFFLDRLRTTSSVVSHCMCSVVTYRFCKRHLPELKDDDNFDDLEIKVITEQSKLIDQSLTKSDSV